MMEYEACGDSISVSALQLINGQACKKCHMLVVRERCNEEKRGKMMLG